MKRLIFTLLVFALMATPVLANPTGDGVSPHLGWWAVGHPRSTHQYWDFTVNVGPDGALYDWIASPPTEMDNTAASAMIRTSASTSDVPAGYTGSSFKDPEWIAVVLNIKNFPDPLAYKEIWVDIGFEGQIINPDADGIGTLNYTTVILPPYSDPEGVAEMGFRIYPNPVEEYVSFTILADWYWICDDTGQQIDLVFGAKLDWIHVDTICIPAPGAIILGSLGVGLVGWLRRRKSL